MADTCVECRSPPLCGVCHIDPSVNQLAAQVEKLVFTDGGGLAIVGGVQDELTSLYDQISPAIQQEIDWSGEPLDAQGHPIPFPQALAKPQQPVPDAAVRQAAANIAQLVQKASNSPAQTAAIQQLAQIGGVTFHPVLDEVGEALASPFAD